jgi:hypothetical protein
MRDTVFGTPTRRQFLASFGAMTGIAVLGLPKILDSSPASTAALPDMIVTAIIVPSEITAGQLFRFGATIKNQGLGATPAGVETGVGFYVDGTQVAWSQNDTTSLAAGASTTLYADHGYPSGSGTWIATAGSHQVTANINWVDRFAETSRTNNSKTVAFTVAAAVTKPVNVTLPVITGTPAVGNTLTASTGTWK